MLAATKALFEQTNWTIQNLIQADTANIQVTQGTAISSSNSIESALTAFQQAMKTIPSNFKSTRGFEDIKHFITHESVFTIYRSWLLSLIAAVETADSQQQWAALNKVQADFVAWKKHP